MKALKSNAEWKEWGRRDPLYGVAAWPGRERGGSRPWTEDEFYATGAATWLGYRSHWEHYGLDRSVCLEIGAGAGRMTESLARDFAVVHAVDVSAEMLALARKRISSQSVIFHMTDGLAIPLPDASVTAVFSTFVFQHFDSPRDAARYLREIARTMAPGATLMIQLPVYVSPIAPGAFRALYALQRRGGQLRANIRRKLMARGGRPIVRGLTYEVSWLQQTLDEMGLSDVEFRITGAMTKHMPLTFVLAKRA